MQRRGDNSVRGRLARLRGMIATWSRCRPRSLNDTPAGGAGPTLDAAAPEAGGIALFGEAEFRRLESGALVRPGAGRAALPHGVRGRLIAGGARPLIWSLKSFAYAVIPVTATGTVLRRVPIRPEHITGV